MFDDKKSTRFTHHNVITFTNVPAPTTKPRVSQRELRYATALYEVAS